MKMHGIYFNNRAKPSEGDCPAKASAEFAAFASLCASNGLASHVRSVEYSSNWCGHSIDVDIMHEHTQIGCGIKWAAEQTLWQFEIFGLVGHKDGAWDWGDWGDAA